MASKVGEEQKYQVKKDRVPLRKMAVGAAYSNYQVRNRVRA